MTGRFRLLAGLICLLQGMLTYVTASAVLVQHPISPEALRQKPQREEASKGCPVVGRAWSDIADWVVSGQFPFESSLRDGLAQPELFALV